MIKITYAGSEYKHPKSFIINRPFGAGTYDLVLFKTSTVLRIAEEKIITNPNSMILFTPLFGQHYYTHEEYLLNDFVHFQMDDDTSDILLSKITANKPFVIRQVDYISKLMWMIACEYNNSFNHRDNNMIQLLNVLIKKVEEECSLSITETNFEHTGPIMTVKTQITSNPQNPWTIKELAASCNMSESYFQIMYKKIYGTSCIQDIIKSRLTMARELVKNTTLPIQEVALCCGYNSIEHFTRQFKNEFNITPLKYRNQKQNKSQAENN